MLYITLSKPYCSTIPHKLGSVHLLFLEEGAEVSSVEADEEELQYIRDNMPPYSLPDVPDKRIVKWFGGHAKFIVYNLF